MTANEHEDRAAAIVPELRTVSVVLAPQTVTQVVLMVAPMLAAVVSIAWAPKHPSLVLVAVAALAWIASLLGSLRAARTRIEVSGSAIRIDRRWGRSRFTMPRLRQGWVHPVPGGYRACIVVRGGYLLSVSFDDVDAAHAFLAPLIGTAIVSDRLPLSWPKSVLGTRSIAASLGLAVCAAAVAVVACAVGATFWQLAWLCCVPVVTFARARSHVAFGHDGLLVTVVGESRFVRYDEIRDVEVVGAHAVRLTLRDGARIRLALQVWAPLGTVNAELATAWIARCVEWARHGALAAEGRSFARNGRSLTDWRRALGAMLRAGYRAVRATPAMADEILRDARNAPSARLGAALALADSGAADGGAALRVAAETCVDPRLRAAFEQVEHGSIDARLLAEIEEEEVRGEPFTATPARSSRSSALRRG